MKKISGMFLGLLILMASISGCKVNEVTFRAIVVDTFESSILVEPIIDSSEKKSADKISVRINNDTIMATTKIEVGDTVEISYDGLIAVSYPAQIIKCFKIEIIN